MIRTKICGITNSRDALRAASSGAWALGFIFYKKSPRSIGPYKAREIIAALPPFVMPVGVFVNQKEGAVKEIAEFCKIRTLQFHGDETPDYCKRFLNFTVIKAFGVGAKLDPAAVRNFKVNAYLFDSHGEDAYGGSGKTFDWKQIKPIKDFGTPVILSGGLNPQNIRAAIEEVKPYAVDVASGVEEFPGKKSEALMKAFLDAVYL